MTEVKNINSPANMEQADYGGTQTEKDGFNLGSSESHTLHFQTFASNEMRDVNSPSKFSGGQLN